MDTNQLDIDHLHYVIEQLQKGYPLHRREGATTALVEMMVGETYLGDDDNFYAVVAPDMHMTNNLTQQFTQRLNEEQIAITCNDKHTVLVNRNRHRFIFMPLGMVHQQARGIQWSRVFVEPAMNEFLERMRPQERELYSDLQYYFRTNDIVGA